jgi:hypothetical protein
MNGLFLDMFCKGYIGPDPDPEPQPDPQPKPNPVPNPNDKNKTDNGTNGGGEKVDPVILVE